MKNKNNKKVNNKNQRQTYNKKETDYKSMFSMGFIFVAVGVVFLTSVSKGLGVAFIFIGGLFMIIGRKNKDKWKNH